MTTIRLWEGVGVGLIGVLGLPFGLAGLVCSATSGQRSEVILSAAGIATIYLSLVCLYNRVLEYLPLTGICLVRAMVMDC